MGATYTGKLIELVDEAFSGFVADMSGKQLSKIEPQQIDKITDRMQAEATAYIGLKGKMYKELIKELSELE